MKEYRPITPLKKIGRGWQYTTYDLSNGRVLKRYNTRFITYYQLFHDCFPYIEHPIWKFSEYYERCKKEAAESLRNIQHVSLERWMLGHPTMRNELDYEQDKVTPLRHYLERATLKEGKQIIDDFIKCNQTLIQHSVIDRNFMITDNFAMNADGKIVLMDLGELYFDAKKIRDHITQRPWATFDVVSSLPRHLRVFFVEKMDATFVQ